MINPHLIKVYPSSATFSVGVENTADFPSQCHRLIWLAASGARKPDDASKESKTVGADFEDSVYKWLQTEFDGQIDKEAELAVIGATGDWVAKGRGDYVVHLDNGRKLAVECKATRSSGTAADFRAGRVKLYHLSQLLIYMVAADCEVGRIYCGVYSKDNKLTYHRFYAVEVDHETGTIVIDGAVFAYKVEDVFTCFDTVADAYFHGLVPNRPVNYNNVWKSPCLRCPFFEACNNYEETGNITEYIAEAKSLTTPKGNEP